MPSYVEAPADGSEVSNGSQLTKRGNKSEEPYETVSEQKATGHPRETDGEDSLESRGDDNDVLYVKGHPVIRNGNRLCNLSSLLLTANTSYQVLMYRSSLSPSEMTVILLSPFVLSS